MDINAELKHPEIQGPPLERGTRYGHHFVVELISDGKRLWAVASEEGRKILHQIAHGLTGDEEPTVGEWGEWVAGGYLAKKYPAQFYDSRSSPEEIAAAIKAEEEVVPDQSGTGPVPVTDQSTQSLDPNGNPATGGAPQPISDFGHSQAFSEAPTTTVSPANSFDS